MIAITLPFFSYLFRGSSGSKSKVDCIAISNVWTTGMLVAVEGPPDNAQEPLPHQTGNAELRTTHLTEALLACLYCFLKLNFSSFGLCIFKMDRAKDMSRNNNK